MKKINFLIWMCLLVAGLMLSACEQDSPKVVDFESCLQAGNPVMESYPRQCRAESGQVFMEAIDLVQPAENGVPVDLEPVEPDDRTGVPDLIELQPPKSNCEDLCGDGKCQEIVCMAIGCPCAETKASCPADCK